jgi:protein CpxP
MNRILLSTSLALALSGSLAFAQQQGAAPAPTAKHHHAHNPQREAAKLSKKLNLSSDQTAKLEPILADRDKKIAALNNDTTISPAVMKQQRQAIRQQTRQQLATVLTPDQIQQLRGMRHGNGRGQQQQSAPTTPAQAEVSTGPPHEAPRQPGGFSLLPARTWRATHFHARSS